MASPWRRWRAISACVIFMCNTLAYASLQAATYTLRQISLGPRRHMRLRIPTKDAVLEDYMASFHAIAAASDDYDATMESLLCGELGERPDYWSRLWPSSVAISRKLAAAPELVRGQSVVELGSGLGACSVCAALIGATSVVATDHEPRALAYTMLNARENGVADLVSPLLFDWSSPPSALQSYDVVIGADVLYERDAPAAIAPLLHSLTKPRGALVLLADDAARPYGDAHRAELLLRLDDHDAHFTMQASEPVEVPAADGAQPHQIQLLLLRRSSTCG